MNTRFSNIPAMRMFALAGTNTLEGPELEALMDQVDKEMNLDGKDVSRFATADNHLDKMTIRNGGKNMTPQQKKEAIAFAITEYERLGAEAALAACSGDMGKYSQLVLEMEKLAPAFADDTDRQPHVAYGGDDYENPEEAFSDEDATREAEKIWRTHCGYGG